MSQAWYSARCLFRSTGPTEGEHANLYEERVVLWRASSFDQAIQYAEGDAIEYAETLDKEYLGLVQAYELPDPPGAGEEVFSLMRTSALEPDEYLSAFFDTGSELQQH